MSEVKFLKATGYVEIHVEMGLEDFFDLVYSLPALWMRPTRQPAVSIVTTSTSDSGYVPVTLMIAALQPLLKWPLSAEEISGDPHTRFAFLRIAFGEFEPGKTGLIITSRIEAA